MKRPQTLTKSDENRLLLGLVVQPFVAAALTFAICPFIEYSDRLVNGVGRTVDPGGDGVRLCNHGRRRRQRRDGVRLPDPPVAA